MVLDQSRGLDNMINQLMQWQFSGRDIQLIDHILKGLHRLGGTGWQAAVFQRFGQRLPQRTAFITGNGAQRFNGFFAQCTGRYVDHTLDGRIVVAVQNQA